MLYCRSRPSEAHFRPFHPRFRPSNPDPRPSDIQAQGPSILKRAPPPPARRPSNPTRSPPALDRHPPAPISDLPTAKHRRPTCSPMSQPESVRSIINRCRRQGGLIKLVLLGFVCAGSWWLVASGFDSRTVLAVLFSYCIVCAVLDRREVCPRCGGRISMLPSEGHLQMPELSHTVRMCPYCGADFSLPSPNKFQCGVSPCAENPDAGTGGGWD